MNETTDKAQEKLLTSITKSQDATAEEQSEKKPTARKRSTKQNQESDKKTDTDPQNIETRNRFIGKLRWPD